jgi:predicted O-methyltransferase YrrM
MFRFITEVIGGEYDREIMKEVECLRKEMLADRRLLKVHDLGVGSASLRRAERRIGEIAAAAALPASEAALLARIAASLDMIKLGERGTRLQKNKESGAVPGRNEESEAVPGRIRESGAVPGKNEESEAVPGRNAESVASRSGERTERDDGDVIITGGMPKGDLNRGIAGSAGDDREGMLSGGIPKGDTNHHTIQPAVILELGTSLGISTLALALGAPDRKVISIEGCPELAAIARENLRNHGADNAEVLSMEFSEALNHLRSLGTMVEMAFIDGNHRGKALEEYVHLIRGMGEEMIIVADDIRMNRDMTSTWKLLSTVRITDRFTGSEEMATGNLLPGSKVTGSSSGATAVIGNTGVPAGTDKTSISAAAGKDDVATASAAAEKQPLHSLHDKLQSVPVSLETFRLGMLFFMRNITPGHYRVRC